MCSMFLYVQDLSVLVIKEKESEAKQRIARHDSNSQSLQNPRVPCVPRG